MIDLITTLYDWDTFRFTLWHALDMFGLDACLTTWLDSHGYVVWEDYSISEAAS